MLIINHQQCDCKLQSSSVVCDMIWMFSALVYIIISETMNRLCKIGDSYVRRG